MNCQIFIGSVLENYMKFHGLLSHFHRLFSGSSARNKSNQLETNHAVEESARKNHSIERSAGKKAPCREISVIKSPCKSPITFQDTPWRIQL